MNARRRQIRTGPGDRGIRAATVLAAAAAIALSGCDDLLDVEDPDVVTPQQLEGPQAVPALINGAVRDFQEAYDDYVRYTSMFTDEMILAGTFQGRVEVDERRISDQNQQITGELYEPLQRARQTQEDAIAALEGNLEDPEFSEVRGAMRTGIARANLFAGYLHVFMAELYCQAVVDPRGPGLSSDDVMEEALGFLERAETVAGEIGDDAVATAARVGQARAHLWLGDLTQADGLATPANVPDDFVSLVEYSANTPDQNNELAQFTWGFIQQIRWSVGDGNTAERDDERFDYFDEWVSQGLIDPGPGGGLSSQNAVIPVILQQLYDEQGAAMVLASGWEARMIQAEVELRTGDPEVAEDDVNALLEDPSQSLNPMLAANPDLAGTRTAPDGETVPGMGAFQGVDFTGSPSNDLPQLARARLAGLWLTGQRQATSRRFSEDDGIDLYPVRNGGELDVCFPVPQQEKDDNPNF